MPNRRGFTGLIDPPKPLPDEESSAPKPVELHAVPAEQVQTVKKAAKKAPSAEPVSGSSRPVSEPVSQAKSPVIAAPSETTHSGQTGKRRAATSIRIHQPVADDLEDAWLRAKSVDLRLSYTEFVSRLLRRALQDEDQGA